MIKKLLMVFIVVTLSSCAGKQTPQVSKAVESEVYFKTASSNITDAYVAGIQQYVNYFSRHDKEALLIEGHTDQRGSSEYNLDLGDKRARAVKAQLISKGMSEDRILTVSYGEDRPKDSSKLYQNRRAVIRPVNQD